MDMVSRATMVPITIRVMLLLILLHRIHILLTRIIQVVIRVAILSILEGIPRILLILLADHSGILECNHNRERLLRAAQDHLDTLILRIRVVVYLDELVRRAEVAMIDSSLRAVFITLQRRTPRTTLI